MNPASWALKNATTTTVLTVVLAVGGVLAFRSLGRLEDPEFTIKDAKIMTSYPGASAREVEEEVTDILETAVQKLGQLKHVESISKPGLSILTVTMKDHYDAAKLPQVWDELRRKVNDAQRQLPPGAGPSLVNDDFGDVFGVYFAISGDGFTYAELKEYAKLLEKELLLCDDVAKVSLQGFQQEVIYVEISRARMAQLGVSERSIYSALAGKNLVTPTGEVTVGREYLRIIPTGELNTVEEIGSVIVEGLLSEQQIFLRDVADISRGYAEPPADILRVNGRRAIALGISTVAGGNVVTMGQSVMARLRELDAETPIGIERTILYYQPEMVVRSIDAFIVSLLEAVAIVVGVLLFAMGARSGLIIGAILLITILGTFVLMQGNDVAMERISLGALIIALGMLVDNAIVVTDGTLVGIQGGEDPRRAARDVVGKTQWSLLGATVVAILAFAAIGASQDKTGEYTRSLYQVIFYSLGLSWLLAVTVTPLFCVRFLKRPEAGADAADPYGSRFYNAYRAFLGTCIRKRWLTLGLLAVLLVFALSAFRFVPTSFFPSSTTPQFTIDYWTTEGTDIRQTEEDLAGIERHLQGMEGVQSVCTLVAKGALRFALTYAPEDPNTAYGQLIVTVDTYERMAEVMPKIEGYIEANYADALAYAKPYVMGPGGGSDIELRLRGPDHEVLRELAGRVKRIMHASPLARDVRDDWRSKVKTLRPILAEPQASRLGITRADVSRALERNFSGQTVGLYRERDELIPIEARAPAPERMDVDAVEDMRIWSPVARGYVPLRQVVSGFQTVWEDHIIRRRDRRPTITPQCNVTEGVASRLFTRLRPKVEAELAKSLPAGYDFTWGGEYEDSGDAMAALGGKLPLTLVMMVLVVIVLYNALRQPAIIWLTVPLAMIGVSAGLLATGQAFGFMAILGVLSLIGMLIKNAIVLIDEIDLQIKEGVEPYKAIMEASVSRVRPVSMAAATTVLGMIPLLPDPFFSAMAVTIMAGLTFATGLTLLVVPVLYAVFFAIRAPAA